jgi:S1-C subfamily serine protease
VVGLACSGDDDDEAQGSATPGRTAQPTAEAQGGGSAAPIALPTDVSEIFERVSPSVVTVVSESGEGSGVVWDDEGHIVTNNHVVEGAASLGIVLVSGERRPATIVATDPLTDLAVIQAEEDGLPAAEFAERVPKVGELAVAIGNPLGFESSATAGIISGLHRALPSGGQTPALVDLVQTDAAISPGNSGGALVDSTGKVLGINVAYIPPSEQAVSIGFAIPSLTVVEVVEQLISTGSVEHAYIGIEPRPLTPQLASQLGLSASEGVLVFSVTPGSPAASAGLMPGDAIIEFDGDEIASVEDLFTALRQKSPGDRVELTVLREGEEMELTVTLGERPS